MSWETSHNKYPCPCGKGYWIDSMRTDDWGRYESNEFLSCEHCNKNYIFHHYYYLSNGMAVDDSILVKKEDYEIYINETAQLKSVCENIEENITKLLIERYYTSWNSRFEQVSKLTKKYVHDKLHTLKLIDIKYSTFCSRIKSGDLKSHTESFLCFKYAKQMLKIINVLDNDIDNLLNEHKDRQSDIYTVRRNLFSSQITKEKS